MKVHIYGSEASAQELFQKVKAVLEEIGLVDFVELVSTQDSALKDELGITQEPALIIEEESIDFKDMIFEGIIPEHEELTAMFFSIVGGGHSHEGGGCGSGGCGSGCSC